MQIYVKKSAFESEEGIMTDVQRLAALQQEKAELERKHIITSKERDEVHGRLKALSRTFTDPKGRVLTNPSMHQGEINIAKKEIEKWEEGQFGQRYRNQKERLESLRDEIRQLETKLRDYVAIDVIELGNG